MKLLNTSHIAYIESKEFLKVLDSILLRYWSDHSKKRKLFFFFGSINITETWYVATDVEEPNNLYKTIVYQKRIDGSIQGVPLRHLAKALEYTLVQKFNDIPVTQKEFIEFLMEYLTYKEFVATTLPEIDKLRGFSNKPELKMGMAF